MTGTECRPNGEKEQQAGSKQGLSLGVPVAIRPPPLPIPVGRGGKCIVSWGTGPAAESGVPGLGDVSPQLKKGLPGHRPHEGRAVVLLASVTTLPDVG